MNSSLQLFALCAESTMGRMRSAEQTRATSYDVAEWNETASLFSAPTDFAYGIHLHGLQRGTFGFVCAARTL